MRLASLGAAGRMEPNGAQVVSEIGGPGRSVPMTAPVIDPIVAGLRQNVTGPGANGRSTTAEELFAVGYPAEAIPVAGKTGTAQGLNSYSWNDSSAFAAFSVDPARPFTVVAYLERARFGSTGAAPVVKCLFLALSGLTALDEPVPAAPLDLASTTPAAPLPPVDTACMDGANADTVRPAD